MTHTYSHTQTHMPGAKLGPPWLSLLQNVSPLPLSVAPSVYVRKLCFRLCMFVPIEIWNKIFHFMSPEQ